MMAERATVKQCEKCSRPACNGYRYCWWCLKRVKESMKQTGYLSEQDSRKRMGEMR